MGKIKIEKGTPFNIQIYGKNFKKEIFETRIQLKSTCGKTTKISCQCSWNEINQILDCEELRFFQKMKSEKNGIMIYIIYYIKIF